MELGAAEPLEAAAFRAAFRLDAEVADTRTLSRLR